MFHIFFLFGLFVRLMLIPVPGFKADVAFWKGWGLAVADKGILWLVNNTNYNYPPGFAYVLWLINKVYALIQSPYNISEYWADNNVIYLFLLKVITIIADIIIVWLIIKVGRLIFAGNSKLSRLGENIIKASALLYFLNPAVIYDGVVWGQVDQFGLMFLLLASYLVLIRRPAFGAAILMLGCLMKLQNIIFIPLIFIFIYRKYSFRGLIWSGAAFIGSFVAIVAPFILGRQMDKLIWLLTVNSDWFPWYSLNAFNGWWIASGLKGMQVVDKHLVLGVTSAKQFGLLLFIAIYFIACVGIFFAKKENLFKNFILGATLVVFGFFHLLTQSHERYLFPITGLLPLIFLLNTDPALFINHKTTFNIKFLLNRKFVIGYLLISLFFFLNMYLSMGWNYPDQVIPRFKMSQTLGLSFWISLIQIGLFLGFLAVYYKELVRKNMFIVAMFAGLLVSLLLAKNYNYLLKKPVLLTGFKPVSFRQDYLSPAVNKTVESERGVKFWNRLSVNYFFYENGIGSHADSEITYHLAGKFSKFTTDFGVDTESDQAAKVVFSLSGDGRELFNSGVRGRFDKPGSASIDVAGIKYLTLKIKRDGESNFGAHADWLNPYLVR